ncbi:MAG: hypothetical protein U0Z44_19905 [Kouleothrix sp.]|jgi:hypothetical protein|nr:hypothetical protein [Kouleothrix sp.]
MPEQNPPRFEQLLDWLEGRLPDDQARAVADQVAQAGQAASADLAWLQRFRELSATLVIEQPPPETRALLVERFRAYAQSRRPASLLQRLIATLTFDSGLQPNTLGVRSAGTPEPQRQLIYSTDIADVALNIQPRRYGQLLDLTCQIFAKEALEPEQFVPQLVRGQLAVASASIDDLGEFVFEGIAAGEYELHLRSDALDIVIASVELRV